MPALSGRRVLSDARAVREAAAPDASGLRPAPPGRRRPAEDRGVKRTSAAGSVRAPPPSTPSTVATETLTGAASRHGMHRKAMRVTLASAGVSARWCGRYRVEDVDAAVARRSAPPSSTTAGVPHVPDDAGRVACGPCWSIAVSTRGRVAVCRWCRESASWAA